ncbi:heparinase II/III family protein [Bacillus sp. FJAT-28004]|uniref:heparinase II/III family protein n=1 Tax=Bacillus sp. FJAT-28004 TaxID=1679165 RepID=UPI0006B4CFA6|nr:heparinase II/III family protein [Bacillus sp. FJAT-28004]
MLNQLTFRQLKNALEETQHQSQTLFAEASSPERWKRMREAAHYSSFWEKLKEQAAQLMENPVSPPLFSEFTLFGDTGDRNIYQKKRDQLYSGLHIFGMLNMIEEKPEWRTGLNNAIWNVCNEYTWVLPAHVGLYHNEYPNGIWDQPLPPRETVDLVAAITAFTLAEIVHLQGDKLHPWVVDRVKEEIDRRIFQVYFHSPLPQNWELKTNNWPAVCSASIGAAAIYLIKDSEKLAGMLWRVLGVFRNYFSGFDEQGATPEGPAYWQYGFSHFVYFAELLKERTLGRISLLEDEKVKNISLFPQMCILSGGKVINFSDSSDEVHFNTGLIHRLQDYVPSLRLPSEAYRMNMQPISWLDTARLILWTPDQLVSEENAEGIQEQLFTGNQWVISKVSHPKGRMYAFAAKGGHNEEPHNHNDLGHFILHVDGENVLADIGIGVYTKQYFQPQYRYEMINASSHGHSVPIVDGCRQGFGRNYHSDILYSQISEDEVQVIIDLTKAYDCVSLQRLTRKFVWSRSRNEIPQLVISDKATFSKAPTSFQEVFISSVLPQETASGRIQMKSVTLNYNPEEWNVDVEAVRADSYTQVSHPFYRVLLNCKNPKTELASEYRFEIIEK